MPTTNNLPSFRIMGPNEQPNLLTPAPTRRSILDFFTGRNRKTLEQVEQLKTQRESEQVKTFVDLAVAFANETPPPAEQVEAILAEAGKSLEELHAEVEAYRVYCRLQRTADRADAAEAERLRLFQAAKEASKRLDEAEQQLKKADQDKRHAWLAHDRASQDATECRAAQHKVSQGEFARFAAHRPEPSA